MASQKPDVTAEITLPDRNIKIPSYMKRKAKSTLGDDGGGPAAKRSRIHVSSLGKSSEIEKNSGTTPPPQAIPDKHPVNIQNGIYAAERLSCSPEVTHSINFILRGEIHLHLESFMQLHSLRTRRQEARFTSHGRIDRASSGRGGSTSLATCLTSCWFF